jgi:outer membrane protein assembly factor BamB
MWHLMEINHRSVRAIIVGAALACLTAPFTYANDWPQWRGPARDDVSTETGLLQDWPANGPKLIWKSEGLGDGYSTVAVAGKKVFTIGDKGNASFVSAVHETDGKAVWSAKLGKPGAPGWGGFAGPRATPTVAGDLLFAVGQWGELLCVESATGKERWRKDFARDFGGTRPEWGYAESPLVDDVNVVVTPGGPQGAIAAINKKTGATVWQSKEFTDPAQYSSLILAEISGVRQYVQLTAASVVGIAAKDGALLWKAPRRGKTAVIPTPIYHDGFVYVASGYGDGCNCFQISSDSGKFTAKEIYANKVMVNHHGGVVLVEGHVYGYSDSKGWTCQDFKTGAALWQDKEKLGKGSLTFADGRLYLRQEDKAGTVALIEASAAGYKEHGRFNPANRSQKQSWPHPVIANGKLYLRDQNVLSCYDVKAK